MPKPFLDIKARKKEARAIRSAQRGESAGFQFLYEKYRSFVFSICLRMVRNREEATDLAQEAFIKVFGSLDRYNPEYAFSSWLFKITSNLCIDHLRKRRITTFAMEDPVESEKGEYTRQYVAPDLPPDETFSRHEKMQKLEKGIAALPEHYRIMLILRHQEDLSYEEIAESLSIPLGTVKARIHRAREMLKTILEGEDFFA